MNPCTVEHIELGPGGIHIIVRAHDTGRQYVAVVTHEALELDPPPAPVAVADPVNPTDPATENVILPDGTTAPVTPIDGDDNNEGEPTA